MASIMNRSTVMLLLGSLVALNLIARASGQVNGGAGVIEPAWQAANSMPTKQSEQSGGASGATNKPDIVLGWTNWPAFGSARPILTPITNVMSPYTQGLTSNTVGIIPGFSSAYENIDQFGSSVTGIFNPTTLASQLNNGQLSVIPVSLAGFLPGAGSRP